MPSLLRAVSDSGYTNPTPIQQRAIPHVLDGRDILGLAQTGTGKTAAFALPILQRLSQGDAPSRDKRHIRTLVVTPTRELASQIAESFNTYGKHLNLTCGVVFGGVNMNPQESMLRRGVDILVATPGRLLDHLNRDIFRLDKLEIFVLDEADQMLDMGFEPDVRRIIRAIPAKRQTLFFSATMPQRIKKLSDTMLVSPVEVAVVPESTAAERVDQCVYHVSSSDKRSLLVHLLANRALGRVLIFSRTKHGANRLAAHLTEYGSAAAPIHGNKSQSAREKALAAFKSGDIRVLVATDIAARGLDIDDVTHVINYDLPEVPEQYVHRIGRTARAGADGASISFCAPDERSLLSDIERAMRQKVPVSPVPEMTRLTFTDPPRPPLPERGRRGGGGGGGRGGGGGGRNGGGGGGRGGRGGSAPRTASSSDSAATPDTRRPRGTQDAGPRPAPRANPPRGTANARPQGQPNASAPRDGRGTNGGGHTRSAPPAPRAAGGPSRAPRAMPGESLSGGKPRR